MPVVDLQTEPREVNLGASAALPVDNVGPDEAFGAVGVPVAASEVALGAAGEVTKNDEVDGLVGTPVNSTEVKLGAVGAPLNFDK